MGTLCWEIPPPPYPEFLLRARGMLEKLFGGQHFVPATLVVRATVAVTWPLTSKSYILWPERFVPDIFLPHNIRKYVRIYGRIHICTFQTFISVSNVWILTNTVCRQRKIIGFFCSHTLTPPSVSLVYSAMCPPGESISTGYHCGERTPKVCGRTGE